MYVILVSFGRIKTCKIVTRDYPFGKKFDEVVINLVQLLPTVNLRAEQ